FGLLSRHIVCETGIALSDEEIPSNDDSRSLLFGIGPQYPFGGLNRSHITGMVDKIELSEPLPQRTTGYLGLVFPFLRQRDFVIGDSANRFSRLFIREICVVFHRNISFRFTMANQHKQVWPLHKILFFDKGFEMISTQYSITKTQWKKICRRFMQ